MGAKFTSVQLMKMLWRVFVVFCWERNRNFVGLHFGARRLPTPPTRANKYRVVHCFKIDGDVIPTRSSAFIWLKT